MVALWWGMCFRCEPAAFWHHLESEKRIIREHMHNLHERLRKIQCNTFSTRLTNVELELYQSIVEILQEGVCSTALESTVLKLRSLQQSALDDMLFDKKDSGVIFLRGTRRITFASDPSECVRLLAHEIISTQAHYASEIRHAQEIMRLWCIFTSAS